MRNIICALLISLFALTSCSEYQKLLKSKDYKKMYKKAVEYYKQKDYTRSYSLFEHVRTVFRGTNRAPIISYYSSYCMYGQGYYGMAGDLFDDLVKSFPSSSFVEEGMYMRAYCYYLSSPTYMLDQSDTQKAIDAFDLFINHYPYSSKVVKANKYIDEMRDKLAYKEYYGARSYYDREKYQAAIVSLLNCLKDYPESKHREEVLYLLFCSRYEIARNSVEEKMLGRYNEAKEEYLTFIDEFPKSEFASEMERKYLRIEKYLTNIQKENK
ncbi:MAG: outer membrane protein assembly factor BamD [Marinifilaceae bacterium]|jgi:outer membrane protein assembly factor BamD|nr:outer membrane protein assembly factor BamD [Marinilabiliaceae bacterium JC040]MCT4599568.1 outer membrane protein assembly factor BamD [Marinifilaceae bacterium]